MTNDKAAADELKWTQVLYAEAWKQYCHEDNLGQSRNNLFLGVQGGLLGILTLASKPLLDLDMVQVLGYRVHIGLGVLGILAVLVGLFSLVLTRVWKGVIEAGRRYLNVRWAPIIAIERKVGIEALGIASIEHRWRSHSRQSKEMFVPFPDFPDVGLQLLPDTRGWNSMFRVVDGVQLVALLMVLAGLCLLVTTVVLAAPVV